MKTLLLSICGFLMVILVQLPVLGQLHRISLDHKYLTAPIPSIHVTKLIDARISKTDIGWVQTGMLNKKVPAAFDKPLEEAVGELLARSLPREQGRTVVVKVLQLQVSELTTLSSETAKAEVTLEFFFQQDDRYFFLTKTAAVAESRGLDVTSHHADNLTRAISQCLEYLALVPIDEKITQGPALTREDVQDAASQETTAILTALAEQAPVRGIYNSVYEFMTNAPGTTATFEIDIQPIAGKKGTGHFAYTPYYPLPNGKRKAIKNVWGFSDGHAVLINHGNHYYPLLRKGDTFTFFGSRGPDQQAVAIGAFAGGLLGAAIASAATSGGEVEYILRLPSGEIVERLTQDGPSGTEQPTLASATVILYRLPQTKNVPGGELYVGEELVQTLGPYAVYEMEWQETFPLTLCVKGPVETCLTFIPKPGAIQYLEYSTVKGRPQLTPVDTKSGEHYVKRLHYLAEKERQAGTPKR